MANPRFMVARFLDVGWLLVAGYDGSGLVD